MTMAGMVVIMNYDDNDESMMMTIMMVLDTAYFQSRLTMVLLLKQSQV